MSKTYEARRRAAASRPAVVSHYAGAVVDRGRDLGAVLVICTLFWLIFYLNMPDNLEGFAAGGVANAANIFARNVKAAMIVVSAYLILTRWMLARRLAEKVNMGLLAFIVLIPLSAIWSISPSATTLRFISLAATVMVCYAACVVGWHRRRFQQLAIPPLMFILLGSLVVGIVMPDKIAEIGNDLSQKGAWHGITHGKNEFGMVASVATIICVNHWLARGRHTYWAMAAAAVAVVCLVLSKSDTSQFATVVGVLSMVLLMRVPVIRRRYATPVVFGMAAFILVYELAIQDLIPGVSILLAPVLNLTGKDATFSARTVIWQVIKDHIQGAPYVGTGYGAYWLGPDPSSPSYIFVSQMSFYPMEAHNGYLEIMNDLGMLGLLCLLLYLFWFVRQGLQLMRIDPSQAALYLGLLFQEMVINMSESDWLSRTNTFAILLLATVCLSRGLLELRPTDQRPRAGFRRQMR